METAALVTFVVSVIGISMSGVLMPGPVTAVTLARGADSPHAGAWVSVGHGVVEFPLMALIYFGGAELFKLDPVKIGIGVAGGMVLLWMGAGMLRDFDKAEVPGDAEGIGGMSRSPFMAGMFLSAGNPYFLVWWATVGAALVASSLEFGLFGFLVLAVSHWLCDLAWYYFLSAVSFSGGRFFGQRLQQGAFIVCGLALFYFAGFFLAKSALTLKALI